MSRRWSKHVGVRPFSGRVYTEKRGGRWVVRYEWHAPDGRHRQTQGPDTPENRAAAERILEAGLAQAAGKASPLALTLDQLLTDYRENAALRRAKRTGQPLRPATLRLYDGYHATLRAAFDKNRLAAGLRRAEVLDLIDRLRKDGWAEGSIARLVDHLLQVYRWAARRERLAANPIDGVEIPSRKARTEAYTEDEGRRLLDALHAPRFDSKHRRRRFDDWRFRAVALVEAGYGVRASQAIYLQWPDVDFDRTLRIPLPDGSFVTFDGTITFRQETVGSKGQPDRTVPMWPIVREALLEAQNRRREGSPWVVSNWQDPQRPVSYDGMQRSLHRLERLAGVATKRGRAFHAFRRTLATALARELGIPQAAALMGDTPGVIAGVYVKPSEQDLGAAAVVAARRLTAGTGGAP